MENQWITEGELLAIIRQRISQSKSQAAFAREVGISPQYLSDILFHRKRISDEVAAKLGYRLARMYLAE